MLSSSGGKLSESPRLKRNCVYLEWVVLIWRQQRSSMTGFCWSNQAEIYIDLTANNEHSKCSIAATQKSLHRCRIAVIVETDNILHNLHISALATFILWNCHISAALAPVTIPFPASASIPMHNTTPRRGPSLPAIKYISHRAAE